jgi:hypothetical protein
MFIPATGPSRKPVLWVGRRIWARLSSAVERPSTTNADSQRRRRVRITLFEGIVM